MARSAAPPAPILARDTQASGYLDLARAAAALAVLLLHAKVAVLIPYSQVTHHNPPLFTLYALSTRGYQCVMVFFVLSGYLISSTVLRAMAAGRWSWRRYLVDRLTRLWVVLLPALVLTAVWDHAIATFTHEVVHGAGPGVFLGNLFFLQGIMVPVFGQNAPLWSLSFEFWFYILFPCLALCVLSPKLHQRLIYGAAALGVATFAGKTISLYFLIWLAGTVPVLFPRSLAVLTRPAGRTFALIGTLFVFLAVVGARRDASSAQLFSYDLATGVSFAAVVYVLVQGYSRTWTSAAYPWRRLFSFAAGFSYTLYLAHYPLFNFMAAWLGPRRLQPTPRNLLVFSGVTAGTLVYAWLLSLITEAQTGRLRAFVTARLVAGSARMQRLVRAPADRAELPTT